MGVTENVALPVTGAMTLRMQGAQGHPVPVEKTRLADAVPLLSGNLHESS